MFRGTIGGKTLTAMVVNWEKVRCKKMVERETRRELLILNVVCGKEKFRV
jgi:hypothetical protein